LGSNFSELQDIGERLPLVVAGLDVGEKTLSASEIGVVSWDGGIKSLRLGGVEARGGVSGSEWEDVGRFFGLIRDDSVSIAWLQLVFGQWWVGDGWRTEVNLGETILEGSRSFYIVCLEASTLFHFQASNSTARRFDVEVVVENKGCQIPIVGTYPATLF
jgi:hypothetical protein